MYICILYFSPLTGSRWLCKKSATISGEIGAEEELESGRLVAPCHVDCGAGAGWGVAGDAWGKSEPL